jgi:hypothetical protein
MARIVAVVCTNHEAVAGGGAPIFIEADGKKVQETAFLLEKIMNATAHDLKNGSIILVDRSRQL